MKKSKEAGRMSYRLSDEDLKKEIRKKRVELMHLENYYNERSRAKNPIPMIA
jgi:hypothetical protein